MRTIGRSYSVPFILAGVICYGVASSQGTVELAPQEPPPDRRTVALEPIVDDVRETLGLDPDTPVRWIGAVERGLIVDADPDQLFRILLNLTRNALQALEAREPRDPGRDQVRITGRREGAAHRLGELGVWVRLHYVYPYPHVDEVIPLMAEGLLTPESARELLECFFIKFNNHPAPPKVGVTAAESGTYTDFANINIGGLLRDGSDGSNEISHILLEIVDEMQILKV